VRVGRRWWLGAALLALLLFVGYGWMRLRLASLYDPERIGQMAPDISLADLDGAEVTLRPGQGRALLINFWASWCAPCRAEIPMLADLQRQYGGSDFTVVGIGVDRAPALKRAAKALGVNYPVLVADPRSEDISRQLGDIGGVLPYSVLIGRNGVIRALQVGAMSHDTALNWVVQVSQKTVN